MTKGNGDHAAPAPAPITLLPNDEIAIALLGAAERYDAARAAETLAQAMKKEAASDLDLYLAVFPDTAILIGGFRLSVVRPDPKPTTDVDMLMKTLLEKGVPAAVLAECRELATSKTPIASYPSVRREREKRAKAKEKEE